MALALRAASVTYADLIADARLQGARASRARRSASRRTLDAEAVRNGTLPTATGTVTLPILS